MADQDRVRRNGSFALRVNASSRATRRRLWKLRRHRGCCFVQGQTRRKTGTQSYRSHAGLHEMAGLPEHARRTRPKRSALRNPASAFPIDPRRFALRVVHAHHHPARAGRRSAGRCVFRLGSARRIRPEHRARREPAAHDLRNAAHLRQGELLLHVPAWRERSGRRTQLAAVHRCKQAVMGRVLAVLRPAHRCADRRRNMVEHSDHRFGR
jgi:hypothetical protein